MANIKDLKKKIKSTKGTFKITQAMKLVSAAKLNKAQNAIQSARPYADELEDSIKTISALVQGYSHSYLEEKESNQEIKKIRGANKETLLTKSEILERTLTNSVESEILDAEKGLSFLATAGSTAPFIGLFGTVWGIMGAFHTIGATNMASLAVVAPGISEALIATAIGLVAAIPATIGYNHFVSQIRREEIDLNSFASDFLNIVKRNFFSGNN